MKKIGIYHDRDLDGLCCAAIMKLRYPDIKLIGWDYGYDPADFFKQIAENVIEIGEPPLSECAVYMCDVSMNFGSMMDIGQRAAYFVWIDHHKKAIDELRDIFTAHSPAVLVEGDGAACEIAWRYFFPDQETPEIVTSLGVYDTWRKDDPDRSWNTWILPIQMYYNAHWDRVITMLLSDIQPANRNDTDLISDIVHDGTAMLQYERSQILRAMSKGSIVDIPNGLSHVPAFIINATVNPGRLADEVWKQHPECEVLIQYHRMTDGRWKYSLRSQDDGSNVAEIAAQYGGGGHSNAAGFVSPELLFLKLSRI